MLRQRVITAIIMAGLFLSAVAFLSQAWLALLFGVLVCLGGWEWSRLCGWESNPSRALYVLVLAAVMGFLYHYCQLGGAPVREQVQPFLGLACLWWSLALLWVKGYPGSAVFWRTRAMRNLMGLLVLAGSVVLIRPGPGFPGVQALFPVLGTVLMVLFGDNPVELVCIFGHRFHPSCCSIPTSSPSK